MTHGAHPGKIMGVTAVFVAELGELRPQAGHQVRIDGRDYSVWLLDDGEDPDGRGQIRVLDNACLHVGGPIVGRGGTRRLRHLPLARLDLRPGHGGAQDRVR